MSQFLLNPRGRFNFESNPIAPRPSALENKVLGLVDNSKVNADRYLKNIETLLRTRFNISDVIHIRKNVAGTPAPFTQAFFEKCDFAVNAFGD